MTSNLFNKKILITGATSGIGKAIAWQLAPLGAILILHGRNKEKLDKVKQELNTQFPDITIYLLLADLTDKQQIINLSNQCKEQFNELHILINNAGGILNKTISHNTQGWENTFTLNVLAPYMLSILLYPLLSQHDNSKIINTASIAHVLGKRNHKNINSEHNYAPFQAYATAKLNTIILSKAFCQMQPQGKYRVNALTYHPGLSASNFAGDSNSIMNILFKKFKFLFAAPQLAANTVVYLCQSDNNKFQCGSYFHNSRKAKIFKPYSLNPLNIPLWDICKKMTGIHFD